ncbi:MAG: hypothetical protein ABFS46_20065, partial [Myxococcota bacterium]
MWLQRAAGRAEASGGFVLYVEGPRDRDIVRAWARRLSPRLGRAVGGSAVILGGRQPARAVAHLRELRSRGGRWRGLCVLDRDDPVAPAGPGREVEPGLDFFTWSRRHIESYLLVPDTIRRGLRISPDEPRGRWLRELLPDPGDEEALSQFDAKRLLGRNGPLAEAVGSITPSRIARLM